MGSLKRVLREAAERVIGPGRVGRLEYYLGYQKHFYPWRGPMNGQTARAEIVRQIITECGVELIVETGTYRGTTTEWFAQFGIPVITIELSERFAEFSRMRLRNCANVQLLVGNSAETLRVIVGRVPKAEAITLFYLDAHWMDHLPLREELETIFAHFSRALVVVDDFKVEGDPSYRYDDYGPGKALTLEYVQAAKLPALSIFFPSVKAEHETGAKRGCVIMTANERLAASLAKISLLNSWTGGSSA